MIRQSFQEVLVRRNDLMHKHAIWVEVVDHLKKFLDTDTSPAKVGIATKGEGVTVPQSAIDAVIAEIEAGPTTKILDELQGINNSEVAENVRKEDQAGTQAGRKGRKGKGRSSAED